MTRPATGRAGSRPGRRDRGGGLGSVPAVSRGPTHQPVHDDALLLGRVAFPAPVGQALPQDAADVLGVVQADA